MPAASLWARVPHYVAAAPNPKAALALVRKLEALVGVTVDAAELETAAADYERQVSLAVQIDPDVQAFVERLEQAAEEEDAAPDPGDLPSGDVLAREFQRFLRQRGADAAVAASDSRPASAASSGTTAPRRPASSARRPPRSRARRASARRARRRCAGR